MRDAWTAENSVRWEFSRRFALFPVKTFKPQGAYWEPDQTTWMEFYWAFHGLLDTLPVTTQTKDALKTKYPPYQNTELQKKNTLTIKTLEDAFSWVNRRPAPPIALVCSPETYAHVRCISQGANEPGISVFFSSMSVYLKESQKEPVLAFYDQEALTKYLSEKP